MGFRNDAYATVWSVEPISDKVTKGRISISAKNKATGEYEQEFGGYVKFLGTAVAKKAAQLKEKDRIKLLSVDHCNRYDREKKIEYNDDKIFAFELADDTPQQSSDTMSAVEEGASGDELPF